jgi:hypothetical protein
LLSDGSEAGIEPAALADSAERSDSEGAGSAASALGTATGANRTHTVINLLGIGLPVVGLVTAVALVWNRGVGVTALGILAIGYVLTGVGITVGYHRLFTHRAFQTYRSVRYIFAVLGQMVSRATLSAGLPTIASTTSFPTAKETRTARTSALAKERSTP